MHAGDWSLRLRMCLSMTRKCDQRLAAFLVANERTTAVSTPLSCTHLKE